MLLNVDCLPNAVGKQHTLDSSWKKMDVKLMMMMMITETIISKEYLSHICNSILETEIKQHSN